MLIYLHKIATVVHRDLKSEIILLLHKINNFAFKLADIGLSTRFNSENKLNF